MTDYLYEIDSIPMWGVYGSQCTYHHDGLYYAFIEHDDYVGQPDLHIQVLPGPMPPD